MSRCLLYTYNSAAGAVAVGDAVPVGGQSAIVRRHGCAANPVSTGIQLSEEGYYKVLATISATAAAAGTMTASLYQDGTAVPGAVISATAAAAGGALTLKIPDAAVRVLRCPCRSTLTFVLSGVAATSATITVLVDKE